MAKFIKSLFTPGERRRGSREGRLEEDGDFTPPLDGRRKLSISRSGRMRQNNKKRSSLSNELFGEEARRHERPASKEYHVHGKSFSSNQQVSSGEAPSPASTRKHSLQMAKEKPLELDLKNQITIENHVMTPEEEIEIAFKVLDNNT